MPHVRRLSQTVLFCCDTATIAVDPGKDLAKEGLGLLSDVDCVLFSSAKGILDGPGLTERWGYTGRIVAPYPIIDYARMTLPKIWRETEVDSFFEKVEVLRSDAVVVGDVEVAAVAVQGGYGEVSWEVKILRSGQCVHIATGRSPVRFRRIQHFIHTTNYNAIQQQQHADFVNTVKIAVAEDRHVIVPLYKGFLSFAAAGVMKLVKEEVGGQVFGVSGSGKGFEEYSGRVYEYLPEEEKGKVVLPDRPCVTKVRTVEHETLEQLLSLQRTAVLMLLDPAGWDAANLSTILATKTRGFPVTVADPSPPDTLEGWEHNIHAPHKYTPTHPPTSLPPVSLPPGAISHLLQRDTTIQIDAMPVLPIPATMVTSTGKEGRLSRFNAAGSRPMWRLGKTKIQFSDGGRCKLIKTDHGAARPWGGDDGGVHPLTDPGVTTMLDKNKAAVTLNPDGAALITFKESATKVDITWAKQKLDKVLL